MKPARPHVSTFERLEFQSRWLYNEITKTIQPTLQTLVKSFDETFPQVDIKVSTGSCRKVEHPLPHSLCCSQPFRCTVNQCLWWLQPTENLLCHLAALPKGMSIHGGDCVWMIVAMSPTETIKSSVAASGQNKEPLFSGNSPTLGLSESKVEAGGQRKPHGQKINAGKAASPRDHAAYLSQTSWRKSAIQRCSAGLLLSICQIRCQSVF